MKVSVEKKPTSEAVLDVELTWDEMEKASDKAYRKLVQKVDIQGFRRGKAPRTILERRLGKEYIYQEGLDDLITETYRDAVKEHDLTPITQPKLDAPVFEMGQPYHFTLTVPIVTPVELGDYHALKFEREEATVTSEEVDKEIDSLRNRQATWESVERPAQYDDRVTVDLKLTPVEPVEGIETISNLTDNTFELTNERHGVFSGMDEHLVGAQAGESKTFTTTIPEDYSNPKLAGKEATYEVTIHKIEEKHLPELDDEFAKKVSDGQYESLEDLSKGISDNILESKKRRINDELRDKVLNAVIEQSTFTIHPLLIEEEVHDMEHQFSHLLEQQHLTMDQYLKMVRKTHEEYHQELHPDAEQRVKRQLVLEEVARQENVDIDSGEIEALFNAYAQMGQELPRTEEQIRALALAYRREKTLTRLIDIVAGPDPDAESEEEATEEATLANAEAAALAGESAVDETLQSENETEETPLAGTTSEETVE